MTAALQGSMKPVGEASGVAEAGLPWWRHGIMWLVVGGPAAVVVAGLVTAAIAIDGADPIVSEPVVADQRSGSHAPAVKARNHAATPAQR
jgi:uncharacterized protein